MFRKMVDQKSVVLSAWANLRLDSHSGACLAVTSFIKDALTNGWSGGRFAPCVCRISSSSPSPESRRHAAKGRARIIEHSFHEDKQFSKHLQFSLHACLKCLPSGAFHFDICDTSALCKRFFSYARTHIFVCLLSSIVLECSINVLLHEGCRCLGQSGQVNWSGGDLFLVCGRTMQEMNN